MGLSRSFVLGPAHVPLSGRQLIVLGRAGPRAEGAAQTRHNTRAWSARAYLISCRAKKPGHGPAHGPRAGWAIIAVDTLRCTCFHLWMMTADDPDERNMTRHNTMTRRCSSHKEIAK